MPLVAVEGNIGAGKTTISHILANYLKCARITNPYQLNPFLKTYYERGRMALEMELTFLMLKYSALRERVRTGDGSGFYVSDFWLDASHVYSNANLSAVERSLVNPILAHAKETVRQPEVVIHVRAPTDILMERIRHRLSWLDRKISVEYVTRLQEAFEEFFNGVADGGEVPVITIDTAQHDLTGDADARAQLCKTVEQYLSGRIEQ